MNHPIRLVLATILLALVLGGCATRNMLPSPAGQRAMLAGNDPISYHTQSTPVRGDAKITAVHETGLYFFASETNKALFMKDPKKYAPQYGGYCSNGAVYAILLGGTADQYKLVNGRLFMFGDGNSKKYWEMDQAENIRLGDHFWETEMDGVWSATLHSYRRILFKVPHYKTGAELEKEWQARQAKK